VRSTTTRSGLSVLLTGAATAAAVLVPGTAAGAATAYSAPLRAAVRALPVAAEDNTGSSRTLWGQWTDADRDCHNTRQEVLIAEGTGVRFSASSRGCTVSAGTWRSFYDGKTYTSPTQLQIDHFVPVAEAWGSGGRAWTPARRVAFYNDLGVPYALNAMPSALNQSKQASGPEQWMPPANRCRYVEIWVSLKHRWRLSVDPAERDALPRHPVDRPAGVIAAPQRSVSVMALIARPTAS
jgi:hypothetical protein